MTEQERCNTPLTAPDRLMEFDEAVRSGATKKRLIDAAIAGEIELLFEIPASVNAVLLPLLNQGLNPMVGTPDFMRTPEYLVLEPRYCQVLPHKSSVLVRESKRGYRRTSGRSLLQCLDPSNADKEKMWPVSVDGVKSAPSESARWGRWGSWGLRINGAPFDHQVNRESLLVQASQVYQWMNWKMKDKPTSLYLPTEHARENGDADFVSSQLMRMCEAADRFWGGPRLIQGERDTYPSPEMIVQWFLTSGAGFSQDSAVAAARLITPDWADMVGRRSKKGG